MFSFLTNLYFKAFKTLNNQYGEHKEGFFDTPHMLSQGYICDLSPTILFAHRLEIYTMTWREYERIGQTDRVVYKPGFRLCKYLIQI